MAGPLWVWCGLALLLGQAAVSGCAMTRQSTVAVPSREAAVLADFHQRAAGYMSLHRRLLTATDTQRPNQTEAQQVLARRIHDARRNAAQGDILTPGIAGVMRSALNPELRGLRAAPTRAAIRDDAPTQFALRVNDSYPEGASRSTVPPNVLSVLPRLPEGLEYRIVGNHLVLLDVGAAIVVDYLVNVLCARC